MPGRSSVSEVVPQARRPVTAVIGEGLPLRHPDATLSSSAVRRSSPTIRHTTRCTDLRKKYLFQSTTPASSTAAACTSAREDQPSHLPPATRTNSATQTQCHHAARTLTAPRAHHHQLSQPNRPHSLRYSPGPAWATRRSTCSKSTTRLTTSSQKKPGMVLGSHCVPRQE